MKQFRKTNVLVTGGAGFVGSNLVRRLLTLGVSSIHVVDNLLSSERTNLPDEPRIRFTEGSIADDAVLSGLTDVYDYIFHLSTYHGNQSSMANPLIDHENNLLTTLKLLERIKDFKRLRKWVYSAAGCAVAEKTYDEAHATLEDTPISVKMDSPYSISKVVGEFYAVYYHSQHNVPTVRARFQNVYGPGEILGAGQWRGTPATVWRNVIPTFIYKALHGESLPLEGGGETSRDFIFVEDIVEGLLLCALNGQPGEVYNLASGVETTILELAKTINELAGNSAPLNIMPRRNWDHSGKRFGSTSKAKREIGFEARMQLREGLTRTIEWTHQNMSLIDSCIQKHDEHMQAYARTD
jgi:nucleoside-diphosphate-sugar epimerase